MAKTAVPLYAAAEAFYERGDLAALRTMVRGLEKLKQPSLVVAVYQARLGMVAKSRATLAKASRRSGRRKNRIVGDIELRGWEIRTVLRVAFSCLGLVLFEQQPLGSRVNLGSPLPPNWEGSEPHDRADNQPL